MAALEPIWLEKPETARRVGGRIETVLDAAKVRGLRSGENPARWRGHLDQVLPKRPAHTRGHHAALPYVDVPEFVSDLRKSEAVAARALEFAIRHSRYAASGSSQQERTFVAVTEAVLNQVKRIALGPRSINGTTVSRKSAPFSTFGQAK